MFSFFKEIFVKFSFCENLAKTERKNEKKNVMKIAIQVILIFRKRGFWRLSNKKSLNINIPTLSVSVEPRGRTSVSVEPRGRTSVSVEPRGRTSVSNLGFGRNSV